MLQLVIQRNNQLKQISNIHYIYAVHLHGGVVQEQHSV